MALTIEDKQWLYEQMTDLALETNGAVMDAEERVMTELRILRHKAVDPYATMRALAVTAVQWKCKECPATGWILYDVDDERCVLDEGC